MDKKRIELYRERLAVKEMLSTLSLASQCVHSCTVDGLSEEMFKLAGKIYEENFAGKRKQQEFGCFIAYSLSIFKNSLSLNREEPIV
jgi:hypothetical protein